MKQAVTKQAITIPRGTNQNYDDVVDAIEWHMATYGSGVNTLAVMVRRGPDYAEWKNRKKAKAGRA